MYLTGFADEAGRDLETQIEVTKKLGWKNIESRFVKIGDHEAKFIHDISDEDFERTVAMLAEAGVQVNCFGSAVANWGKKIDEPFDTSLAEAKRSIVRMQRLGTKLIRIMSFAVREGEDQMEAERFRRVGELQRLFADHGMSALHENCMNYGGMGWTYTLKLLEHVPGLKLIFDTCNPLHSLDRSKPKPWPKQQNTWEFYTHVREHIAYIHIKDGYLDPDTNKFVYTFPGEGHASVREVLSDAFARGYDGGISIEPHLGAVFHDPASNHAYNAAEMYLEYGRRMVKIVEEAKAAAGKARP